MTPAADLTGFMFIPRLGNTNNGAVYRSVFIERAELNPFDISMKLFFIVMSHRCKTEGLNSKS
jgi:hypothetical protein